ncbi:YjbH domain-containing protein [Comamonadaceae bacterium PP-2]
MSPTGIRPPYAPSIIAQFIRTGALPLLVAGAASTGWAQQQHSLSSSIPVTDQVVAGERLSTYLARQPKIDSLYLAGLQWNVPQERIRQQALQQQLMLQAASFGRFPKLVNWLQHRTATGRVALGVPDERWLFANPTEDPILEAGQSVLIPSRPTTVTVVRENGDICQVPHRPAALAWQYLEACTSSSDARQRDRAWIAQPDGQQLVYGIGLWNAENQLPPAPGAWIWAPHRESKIPEVFSERMVAYLATQGVASDGLGRMTSVLSEKNQTAGSRSRNLPVTASDWGEIGLLQTPSARMAEEGEFRVHLSRVQPYTRGTVMFSPLPWLEGGFRYTDIADRDYGRALTSQSYKDKSIDVKLRLWSETQIIPQVAVGLRDIGGTGLFSSEYIVASKRTGSIDWSLGLGWGYLGTRGDIKNPLSFASKKFANRPGGVTAGDTNFDSMFRGPTALFGGLQWHTPIESIILKLEYEGNDYSNEPAITPQKQGSPLNFGIVYRHSKYLDLTAGLERGNRLMLGLTLRNNLATAYTPKAFDPLPPPINVVAPTTAPNWQTTAAELTEQTNWQIQGIGRQGNVLHVDLEDSGSTYRKDRVERAIALLNRESPADIDYFSIDFTHHGLLLDTQKVNRKDWISRQTTAHYPSEVGNLGLPYSTSRGEGSVTEWIASQKKQSNNTKDRASSYSPLSANFKENLTPASQKETPLYLSDNKLEDTHVFWTSERDRLRGGITPSFWQSFGGPDSFMLYQLGIRASGEFRITPSTWISGSANLRLIDNYEKFKYTAPSSLPRVRTYMREYVTTEKLTLANLQATHVKQFGENHFAMVYGGLLEPMFAGIGGEWLYRPVASKWAVSVDINRVKQRGFEQRFSMRDYSVTTGHATLYWDTGWYGINSSISVGQYLAGDRGATVTLSKRFDNGVLLGAWATKTNISAAQFGEGSFDKGVFLTIPFDLMLPKSTVTNGTFLYTPLTRDGGAKLSRAWQLYSVTSTRDANAFNYTSKIDQTRSLHNHQTGQDILWPAR